MTCQWHCAIPAKQRDHFVLLSALERWWFYQLWTLWSSFKVLRTIRASAAPGAVGLCPGSFAACLVVHYSPSNNVLHASSKNIIVRSFPMRPTLPLVGKKVSVCPKKRRISDYRGRIKKWIAFPLCILEVHLSMLVVDRLADVIERAWNIPLWWDEGSRAIHAIFVPYFCMSKRHRHLHGKGKKHSSA